MEVSTVGLKDFHSKIYLSLIHFFVFIYFSPNYKMLIPIICLLMALYLKAASKYSYKYGIMNMLLLVHKNNRHKKLIQAKPSQWINVK